MVSGIANIWSRCCIDMDDVENAKQRRSIAKVQFIRTERKLERILGSDDEEGLLWTLEQRYSELKTKWKVVEDAHDEYVTLLPDEDGKNAEEAWLNELSDRFDEIELATGKQIQSIKNSEVSVRELTHKATKPTLLSPSSASSSESKVIKIEPLKFSKFTGDIRKYPQFKAEFIKHIKPLCSSDQEVIVLKSYLSDEVRDIVDNVGDDSREVWVRMDQKYGNTGKLVDKILCDVKSLSRTNPGNDPLKMIAIVERAYRDLDRLGDLEMCNNTTISIIENAMPREIRTEWVKIIASKTFNSKLKFQALFDFLLEWRNRLEYDESTIRNDTEQLGQNFHMGGLRQGNRTIRKKKCWLHNLEGEAGDHPIWKCRLFLNKPVQERIQLVSDNNACKRCLVTECPGASDIHNCERRFLCSRQGCGAEHNSLLHVTALAGRTNHANANRNSDQQNIEHSDSTLLPLQEL